MKVIITIILLGFSAISQAQIELDRQVIGAGSISFDNGSDFALDASIGEVMVETKSSTDLLLTDGFQQSNYILRSPLILELSGTNAACFGANDGSASPTFVSDEISEPRTYNWSNGAITESIFGLEAGTYALTVTGNNGKSVTNEITIEAEEQVDCTPQFYTGFTPNGDGKNDIWEIDNAQFFTSRKVKVYNRYGNLIWQTDNYDNATSFFSGTHTNGNILPSGTYFYVAEFDNSTFNGFIDITTDNDD